MKEQQWEGGRGENYIVRRRMLVRDMATSKCDAGKVMLFDVSDNPTIPDTTLENQAQNTTVMQSMSRERDVLFYDHIHCTTNYGRPSHAMQQKHPIYPLHLFTSSPPLSPSSLLAPRLSNPQRQPSSPPPHSSSAAPPSPLLSSYHFPSLTDPVCESRYP